MLAVYHAIPHQVHDMWTFIGACSRSIFGKTVGSPSEHGRPRRMPVYFLSIGGPNTIENYQHPATVQLRTVGQEITERVRPKGIVVISAHWQEGATKVGINTAEQAGLIYDFSGFPKHFYEIEYPNKGSPEVAEKVIAKLSASGIQVEEVERGLDHGVWVGFLAAFDPQTNPLNIPIVQVSLFDSNDLEQHYRLGQALQSLRDEDILLIGAGMAVHNLRDFRAIMNTEMTMPYAFSFDDVLEDATTAKPQDRERKMMELSRRVDFRQAHPTLEHILPMYVAAGAAGLDAGRRLWTMPEQSLSWAQYRFGDVVTNVC